jgi:hypothetical protein
MYERIIQGIVNCLLLVKCYTEIIALFVWVIGRIECKVIADLYFKPNVTWNGLLRSIKLLGEYST